MKNGVRGEERNGGAAVRGRACTGTSSSVLKLLSLSCRWYLRDLKGRVLVEYSSILQVRPFRVMISIDWSMAVQGIFSHYSWFWLHPTGSAVFLGLEQKHSGGLGASFREEMFLFSLMWALLGTASFQSGDLAIKCLASLFSCLSFSIPLITIFF